MKVLQKVGSVRLPSDWVLSHPCFESCYSLLYFEVPTIVLKGNDSGTLPHVKKPLH